MLPRRRLGRGIQIVPGSSSKDRGPSSGAGAGGGGAVTRIRGPAWPSSKVTVPTSGNRSMGRPLTRVPLLLSRSRAHQDPSCGKSSTWCRLTPEARRRTAQSSPPSYGEGLCVLPVTRPVVRPRISDLKAGGILAGMGALGGDAGPVVIIDRHGLGRYGSTEIPTASVRFRHWKLFLPQMNANERKSVGIRSPSSAVFHPNAIRLAVGHLS